MKVVFDTNILIDFLNGVDAAREEVRRFEKPARRIWRVRPTSTAEERAYEFRTTLFRSDA